MIKKILNIMFFILLLGRCSASVNAIDIKNLGAEEDKEKISIATKATAFLFINQLARQAADVVSLYAFPARMYYFPSGMYSGMLGYAASKLFDKKVSNPQTCSDMVKELAVPFGVGVTSRLLSAALAEAYKLIENHNASRIATLNIKEVIQNIASNAISLEIISGIVVGALVARFVYNKLIDKTQNKEIVHVYKVHVTP